MPREINKTSPKGHTLNTSNMMAFYYTSLAKLDLHFSVFLSLCVSGLESATKKIFLRTESCKWRSSHFYTMKVSIRQQASAICTLLVLRTTWVCNSLVPTGFFSIGFPESGPSVIVTIMKDSGFCRSQHHLSWNDERYSLDVLVFLFGISLLFYVQF